MDFIESVKEKAKNNKKTIILPEGMDKRTYKAAEQILKEGFADLIILATRKKLKKTVTVLTYQKQLLLIRELAKKHPNM